MTDAPSPRCSSGTDEAREPFERFIVRAGFTDWTRHEDGYLKPLVDRLWRAWPRGIAQAEPEAVAWQARDLKGGIWRHCDYPHSNPEFEYRPLYASPVPSTEGNSHD